MAKLGYSIRGFGSEIDRLADEGKTPLFAAVDGRLAAAIAVADPVKPTSRQAVEQLHALGLKVAMITGDNRRTAEAIGRMLGIDHVIAEVLPEGKVEALHRLRDGGKEIGRASCRERVCPNVEISVGSVTKKKKQPQE